MRVLFNMKRIWNYISDIWQGDDDKLSLKRVFIIALCIEVIRMLEDNKIINEQILSAFYAILGAICITLGIISVSQIMTLRTGAFTKDVTNESKEVVIKTDSTTHNNPVE